MNEDDMIALNKFHSLFRSHDCGVLVGDRVKGFGGIVPHGPALSAGDAPAAPFENPASEGSHGALLTRSKPKLLLWGMKKGTECERNLTPKRDP